MKDKLINHILVDYKHNEADRLQYVYGDDWTSRDLNNAIKDMRDTLEWYTIDQLEELV